MPVLFSMRRMAPFPTAEHFIAELHGQTLCVLIFEMDRHFHGLQQAARYAHQQCRISGVMLKKCVMIAAATSPSGCPQSSHAPRPRQGRDRVQHLTTWRFRARVQHLSTWRCRNRVQLLTAGNLTRVQHPPTGAVWQCRPTCRHHRPHLCTCSSSDSLRTRSFGSKQSVCMAPPATMAGNTTPPDRGDDVSASATHDEAAGRHRVAPSLELGPPGASHAQGQPHAGADRDCDESSGSTPRGQEDVCGERRGGRLQLQLLLGGKGPPLHLRGLFFHSSFFLRFIIFGGDSSRGAGTWQWCHQFFVSMLRLLKIMGPLRQYVAPATYIHSSYPNDLKTSVLCVGCCCWSSPRLYSCLLLHALFPDGCCFVRRPGGRLISMMLCVFGVVMLRCLHMERCQFFARLKLDLCCLPYWCKPASGGWEPLCSKQQ